MSLSFTLLTIAEVAVGLFLIWGFWHEERLVNFEDKILARLGFKRNTRSKAKITPFKAGAESGHSKNCI